ncbi:MAG: hypothetical protein GEU90_07725 [Gemmatimonas sp.]|nr:hypothetical protein [Gemmatimonas sp.]
MKYRCIPALALLLAGVAACAQNGPATAGPERWMGATEIDVDNATPNSIRVYALDAGAETFLGRVDPVSEQALHLPLGRSATIRLVAKPSVDLGRGNQHVSEPILITEGQRVTWRLHASPGTSDLPRLSTVRVFACVDGDRC